MSVKQLQPLPQELVDIQIEMEEHARGYNLDFFATIFELVDVEQLNSIASYGGFPTRYPHWRYGMEYERLAKGYAYGLQKIYEMVINNDPCYAYLLNSNALTDHRLVIAHVYGHCDFFKCNYWFSKTNRKMMDEMANHGNRIRRHMDRHGVEQVEDFIDACLSIENMIDIHSPFVKRRNEPKQDELSEGDEGLTKQERPVRFRSKGYMDSFINPRVRIDDTGKTEEEPAPKVYPEEPVRDVMGFILGHAPLKVWQLDVLSIIRDEAYYFAPQAQTKIMNEGWATFWHSTIMTRHGLHIGGDVISYADHTSGTLASSPQRLNPYKLGVELFRDIEDRWNRGCFGGDYERCDDLVAKRKWNTEAGKGRAKIFEVRRIHNDLTFIDEFLTLEFCRKYKLFAFGYNNDSGYYEIGSRQFEQIKQQLLFNLTNAGRPIINVIDGNYKNRGELYLKHEFNGPELKVTEARDTLQNLYRLWTRPVHIETVLDEQVAVLSFDGHEHEVTITEEAVAVEA
jgi:stage V sporulation protein R